MDPATLPEGVEVTHINLNDGTCAGMVWADKKAMTIQYHPEASPGEGWEHHHDQSDGQMRVRCMMLRPATCQVSDLLPV